MPVPPIALDSDDSSEEVPPPSSSGANSKTIKDRKRSKHRQRSGSQSHTHSKAQRQDKGKSVSRGPIIDHNPKPPSSDGSRSGSAAALASESRRPAIAPIFLAADSDADDDDDDDEEIDQLEDDTLQQPVRERIDAGILKRSRDRSSLNDPPQPRPSKLGRIAANAPSEDEVEMIVRASQQTRSDSRGASSSKVSSKSKSRSPLAAAQQAAQDGPAGYTVVDLTSDASAAPASAAPAAQAAHAAGAGAEQASGVNGMAAEQAQDGDRRGPHVRVDAAGQSGESDNLTDDNDDSISSEIYSTESEPPESGKPFYTSSEGSLHGSDSEDGLGSWTRYDQTHWQGDISHLDKTYKGNYPVRGILRHRRNPRHGFLQYRTWWSGYPMYSVSWEPEANFNDPETVCEYWRRQGGRPAEFPPPPHDKPYVYSSEETDVAQYRRPRAKAHQALRKRRREIRKDKVDAEKLLETFEAARLRQDEKDSRRLERLRARRNITMDTTRMRDSDDEDHVRSRCRRQKMEARKQKKWRRRQDTNGGASASTTLAKNSIAASKVLLPNTSMRASGKSASTSLAKTRASEVDGGFPTEDVDLPAFRPAPAPRPSTGPAAPAPRPLAPKPPPGSFKGAHHRPPKVKVLDVPVRKRLDPFGTWMSELQNSSVGSSKFATSGQPSAPPSASTSSGPSWSMAGTTGANADSSGIANEAPLPQPRVHPSRRALVPGANHQPSAFDLAPHWHDDAERRPSVVHEPSAYSPPPAAFSTTAHPLRQTQASPPPQQAPSASMPSPMPPMSPVSPRAVRFDEPPASLHAPVSPQATDSFWKGRVEFTLGRLALGFEAQLLPSGERSTSKAESLGFDLHADRLEFNAVLPMPIFRQKTAASYALASNAFLLMPTGIARDEGERELENVNELLRQSDLLIVSACKKSQKACIAIFSNLYQVDPDLGLPHGFAALVGPQLWAVPVELPIAPAPSARFFRVLEPIGKDLVSYFDQAQQWTPQVLKQRDVRPSDVRKAMQLAERYQLDLGLAHQISSAYNHVVSLPHTYEHVEVKALVCFVRVLEGGLRDKLGNADSEKLWRQKGDLAVNVFVRNVARRTMIDASGEHGRSPIAEYLRRLKRLKRCRFYAFGFDPSLPDERFTPLFPKNLGIVTISMSALLAELFKASSDAEEGQLASSQNAAEATATADAGSIARALPESWCCLLHPWLISKVKLLVPHLQEVLEGLGIFAPGDMLPPMFELEDQLAAFSREDNIKTIGLENIFSPPFEEPNESSLTDPIQLVRNLDEEILKTLQKVQLDSMYTTRFHVLITAPQATLPKSEAELAGVEPMTFAELLQDGCTALSKFPGNT